MPRSDGDGFTAGEGEGEIVCGDRAESGCDGVVSLFCDGGIREGDVVGR